MGESIRILICGNRDWTCRETIRAWMSPIHNAWRAGKTERPTLIHGACPTGADAIADEIGEELGWRVEAYPADWEAARKAGRLKSAGPIRNRKMAKDGKPNRGLAFGRLTKPNGKDRTGTGDMVDVLNAMGVRVTVVATPGDVP